ncbi:DUF4214 domain-containing protein [Frisingicoccus sp.]|uniref:DUF4214 domain-containing protein n=1 Tax=Frisingicoccus sp. TaxID=1918627 RepID=UPI003AB1AE5E
MFFEQRLLKNCADREIIFWVLFVMFINDVTMAFILALMGRYSLKAMVSILFAETMVLFFTILKSKIKIHRYKISSFISGINVKVGVVLIVASMLYFLFPTEYLWARRDPALYVLNGVNIAKSGGMEFEENTFIRENYEEIQNFTDITYRGFYSDFLEGDEEEPGHLTSQFLHYFSSALAIGYSLAGLQGLFAVNSVIALFCLIAVYYFCKQIFNKNVAFLSILFLACCPAQLWCARIPQTELLYQLFYVVGTYMMCVSLLKEKPVNGFFSGVLIGFIGLNRMDSYVLGIGIFCSAIYFIIFEKTKFRTAIGISFGYIMSSFISIIYTYTYSPYYFIEHWDVGVLKLLAYANVSLVIIEVLAIVMIRLVKVDYNRFNIIRKIADDGLIRSLFFLILSLGFVALYEIRPLLQKGINVDWDFNQRSFVEFCWYTSILTILFFFVGIWKIICKYSNVSKYFVFLATGLSSLIIYLYKPAIAPDHIWASRRWVSVCFVFVFIVAAYGIEEVRKKIDKSSKGYGYISKMVSVAICFFLLFQCRGFIFTPMLHEMQGQYEKLAEQLDDDKVYFAEMPHYASVLQYIYDKNVIVLDENGIDSLEKYIQDNEQPIYYIGSDVDIFGDEFSLKLLYEGEIRGTYLVQKNAEYASKTYMVGNATNLYEVWLSDMDKVEDITAFSNRNIKVQYLSEKQDLIDLERLEADLYGASTIFSGTKYCKYKIDRAIKGTYEINISKNKEVSFGFDKFIFTNDNGEVLHYGDLGNEIQFSFSCSDLADFYLYVYGSHDSNLIKEDQKDLYRVECKYLTNQYDFLWERPKECAELASIISEYGDTVEIVYENKESNFCQFTKMDTLMNYLNRNVEVTKQIEAEEKNNDELRILITEYDAMYIWELLPQYTIIGATGNYVVLVSTPLVADIEAQSLMSKDEWIRLDLFESEERDTISTGRYILQCGNVENIYYVDGNSVVSTEVFSVSNPEKCWVKKDMTKLQDVEAIINCYVLLLGRQPSVAECEGWQKILDDGVSITEMIKMFTGSDEFKRHSSMDAEKFIKAVYQILYKRKPSQKEITYYKKSLNKYDNYEIVVDWIAKDGKENDKL